MASSTKYQKIYADQSPIDESLDFNDALLETDIPEPRPKSFFQRVTVAALGLHLFLVSLEAFLLLVIAFSARASPPASHPRTVYTPANEAIKYNSQKFDLRAQPDGLYSKAPSPEVDQAWHDLLNDSNIRISREDLQHLNREDGVVLPDGMGYVGSLFVYHELHCLKRLKQYMYPEYYWADLSQDQQELNRVHNEHCIDVLRQSVMCHGDVGLLTYYWDPHYLLPMVKDSAHKCIDWRQLEKWAKGRSVNMMEPGLIVHPILGPAYPDGRGGRLGVSHGYDHDVNAS